MTSTGSYFCVKEVCFVLVVLCLFSACHTAPLDTYFTDDTEGLTPQKLQLLKDLREILDLEERNKQPELGKPLSPDAETTGLMRVLPQKRFRPFRTQTRGGREYGFTYLVCKNYHPRFRLGRYSFADEVELRFAFGRYVQQHLGSSPNARVVCWLSKPLLGPPWLYINMTIYQTLGSSNFLTPRTGFILRELTPNFVYQTHGVLNLYLENYFRIK